MTEWIFALIVSPFFCLAFLVFRTLTGAKDEPGTRQRGTMNEAPLSTAGKLSRFQSAYVSFDLFAVLVIKAQELDSKPLPLPFTRIAHT